MPREVEYRDFPDGPIRIEFSDELPHWNMCAPCGMLSAEMYKDERGHFFCRVCVDANSQRERIFCKHENRDVQLSDLTEATELVLSTQELTVFCPNKKQGCTKYCPLNNMEQHWVECPKTPSTKCKACDTMLPMKDLRDHKAHCLETYVQCHICHQGMPRRTYEHHRNECQRFPEPSKRGTKEKKSVPSVSLNASAPPSLMGPEPASMKDPDSSSTKSSTDEEKKSCKFCERPVKKCNYEKHLEVCLKREEECSHCSLPVCRVEWKTHEDMCEKNPVNIKQEPAPSVSKPRKKGKKNLTSDNEAKNSWPPKQLRSSDENSSKDSSYEIITGDEVERAAETKRENKTSFGGPASKHAGTSAVAPYSPIRSTGNAMASDVVRREPKRGADCPHPLDPDHPENDGASPLLSSDPQIAEESSEPKSSTCSLGDFFCIYVAKACFHCCKRI
uniref:Putative tnf receptor-associated factor 6 n=1 Tax=Ixodes ricinus TaxID=34613 RepID=V5HWI4_IXORI